MEIEDISFLENYGNLINLTNLELDLDKFLFKKKKNK